MVVMRNLKIYDSVFRAPPSICRSVHIQAPQWHTFQIFPVPPPGEGNNTRRSQCPVLVEVRSGASVDIMPDLTEAPCVHGFLISTGRVGGARVSPITCPLPVSPASSPLHLPPPPRLAAHHLSDPAFRSLIVTCISRVLFEALCW